MKPQRVLADIPAHKTYLMETCQGDVIGYVCYFLIFPPLHFLGEDLPANQANNLL
jgi:hypothetical protein